ncbi:MAG: peptide-methionine (R)-S-oxide reductase MsrB [Candidatus Gracilibacteria bacterium]|nr:peptide-methionine (R)-S-oxide reductase MsrB [Candidatus Gracilibacteria bacterium]
MNLVKNNLVKNNFKNVYFAGGCFWCLQGIFEVQKGVKEVIVGYLGGLKEDASYEKVSTGKTEHREGIKVTYDSEVISYKDLVELFWMQIDPTDEGGQFVDRGPQYTTAIYYNDDEEKFIALKSKSDLEASGKFNKKIATKIINFTTFFPAEDYHQGYYKKSPIRYDMYSKGSGREDYIFENWRDYKFGNNKNSKKELKEKLTSIQYKVVVEGGTESSFDNEYWDEHREGIYIDIIDGTPLFSSTDKFDSMTGWPSFTKPVDKHILSEEVDNSMYTTRTEVKHNDHHLGHVFDDGPEDKGGLRYCINSASLKFIPKEELEEKGYGKYLKLFKNST